MLATKEGVGVLASKPRRHRWTEAEIARARDLAMLSMRRSGVPVAVIAAVFGTHRHTVRNRLAAIPSKARDFYVSRGVV
jgi:hypothetical protein